MGAVHSIEEGRIRPPKSDCGQERSRRRARRSSSIPADGKVPYQPAAAARRKQLLVDTFTPTKLEHIDPHARSAPDGVPASITCRVEYKSVKSPDTSRSLRVKPRLSRDPDDGVRTRKGHQTVYGGLAGPLGGQDAGRRRDEFQRGHMVRLSWDDRQRRVACRRTLDDGGADRINYEATIEDPEGVCATLGDRCSPSTATRPRGMNSGRTFAPRASATWSAFWQAASARKRRADRYPPARNWPDADTFHVRVQRHRDDLHDVNAEHAERRCLGGLPGRR